MVFGLSRAAAHASKKVEQREDVFFILLFGIMAVAAALAGLVNLPITRATSIREQLPFCGALLQDTSHRTGEEMSYVDFA